MIGEVLEMANKIVMHVCFIVLILNAYIIVETLTIFAGSIVFLSTVFVSALLTLLYARR